MLYAFFPLRSFVVASNLQPQAGDLLVPYALCSLLYALCQSLGYVVGHAEGHFNDPLLLFVQTHRVAEEASHEPDIQRHQSMQFPVQDLQHLSKGVKRTGPSGMDAGFPEPWQGSFLDHVQRRRTISQI